DAPCRRGRARLPLRAGLGLLAAAGRACRRRDAAHVPGSVQRRADRPAGDRIGRYRAGPRRGAGRGPPREPCRRRTMTDSPLSGHTVVVTRDEPGELGERLAGLGAAVVHVPLIEITDPDDGGAALRDATARLGRYDWLIVTSPNGARRVAAASTGVAAWPRAAAVGRGTAATFQALTGRDAELVPEVQRLDGLLDVFPRGDGRVLAARGDLADPALVGGLRELGWTVDDVVA